MIWIEINNSFSQVAGLSPEQHGKLRKLLSYTVNPQAAYFGGYYHAKPRFLIDMKGFFPTGLLYRVLDFMVKEKWDGITTLDKRPKPRHRAIMQLKQPWPTLYDDQRKAIDTAIIQHRGGIIMPTGSGKSLVIAGIIAKLNVKTLIIVPTLEIKHQLMATIKSLFKDHNHVTILNIDSKELAKATAFDCLIIDECHHAAAATYQKLNKTAWKNIYYRFFLTATYYRNQSNEHLLFEGIVGEPIYELTHSEAVERGYIVPVEAYYYDVEPKPAKDLYTWNEVYSNLVVHNTARNEKIAYLLTTISSTRKSSLCLVKEIAHGKLLSKMTGIPFVNGQDEESKKYISDFNNQKIFSLIGTTGVLGEGIDTKPAEYIIIAGLGKAKSAFMQQIGRGVRNFPGKKSCKIVLFKDTSHKFTLKHFKEQIKILKELDVICFKL